MVVKAESCGCEIEIDAHISIDTKEAIFDTGQVVNIKMKELAGDNSATHTTANTNITSILKSSASPNISEMTETNIVSSPESPLPIYMWFNDGAIYWWSEDKTPSMNEDASYMFAVLYSLSDISGLRNIDTSMTVSMRTLFGNSSSLENVNDLKYWNTSNVENLYYLFGTAASAHNAGYVNHIKDITALKYWDVSKVTDMGSMLQNAVLLETLDGLETWDTSSLTNMKNIFGGTIEASLTDISAVSNWNTSKVTTMQWLLENQVKLTDIEALRNWDVSNVEHMGGLFSGSKETGMHIKNFEPISGWDTHSATTFQYIFQQERDFETTEFFKNWNTSNVTEMANAFAYCKSLKTLNGLENWDVSNATNLNGMFSDTISLENASAVNNWNITSVTDFTNIFSNSPVRPEFTKISGTWNGGTFVPNE